MRLSTCNKRRSRRRWGRPTAVQWKSSFLQAGDIMVMIADELQPGWTMHQHVPGQGIVQYRFATAEDAMVRSHLTATVPMRYGERTVRTALIGV